MHSPANRADEDWAVKPNPLKGKVNAADESDDDKDLVDWREHDDLVKHIVAKKPKGEQDAKNPKKNEE